MPQAASHHPRSTPAHPPKRVRGRPRDPEVHQSILRATRELLVEVGYSNLTIERVAERAGVGKPSVYRRWGGKGLLVWEAVFGKSTALPLPDTGRIADDLRTVLRWTVDEAGAPEAQAALPGMLSDFKPKPELRRTVKQQLLDPEYARIRRLLERALERGELRPDLDLDLVMDTLIGTVLGRAVLLERPLDERLVEGLVDLVLEGARVKGGGGDD
jgi:AcrR family transcriptional regulator